MAQEEKWEPFADVVVVVDDDDDEDEALSLSDLPDNLSDDDDNSSSKSKPTCNPHTPDTPDFEFRVSFGGGETTTAAAAAAASSAADMFAADMCAADEVFFRGQLLPLSSCSSSCCSSSESALFRSGSLSDSLDRSASSTGLSSRSSSGCVSRSPSSNNGGGDAAAAPRLSASANYLLYTLPSPSPQIRRKGGVGAPARRSTSSHGPGIFRLGVARAPDIIELRDLRMRSRSRSRSRSHADAAAPDGKKPLGSSSSNNSNNNNSNSNNSIGGSFRLLFPGGGRGNEPKAAGRRSTTRAASLMGRGFGCSCAPDAVEPVTSPIAASLRKKVVAAAAASPPKMKEKEEEEEERRGLKRGESLCRRRILEWIEELSIGKVVMGNY